MNTQLIMLLIFFILIFMVCYEKHNTHTIKRLVIINTQTNSIEFEVIGILTLYNDISIIQPVKNKLTISAHVEKNKYKQHIVELTNQNKYILEELEEIPINQYRYEISYGAKIESTIDNTHTY